MIIISMFFALMLTGCSGGSDMSPVGGGLAVIGLAIIIGSIVNKLPSNEKGDDDEPWK